MQTTPLPTIAEALRCIAADPALKDGHRRQWRCSLGALAKLQRLPPEIIRLDPRESIALLERTSPAALNITEASMANYRAGLRAAGPWLFPGEVSDQQPRAVSGLGTAISENIAQYLGLRINPHAFRCIAGAVILEAEPHAIDDVRAILGHATFATALRFYRRFNTRAAATRLGNTISGLRRSTQHLAQPVRSTRKPPATKTIRAHRGGR